MGSAGCMALASEQSADGLGETLPQRAMVRQRPLSAPGHPVDAPLAPGLSRGPVARQIAAFLEAMQRRIDRSFRQVERAAAARPDLLDDAVAMRRTARERREHD